MTNKSQELGLKVKSYLTELGIETPTVENLLSVSNEEKKKKIELHFSEIMKTLGLDMSDDSLEDTPKRVAKMYVDEVFYGLDYSKFPKCTTVINKAKDDAMVIIRNIKVFSNCEHHFVTIDGYATIAYIPNEKILGLSKFNRIVDFFSRRPQIQERLTPQIFYALKYILDTDNIAVLIDADHYCVKSRGVRDENSFTSTSKLGGLFLTDDGVKAELFNKLQSSK